MGKGRAKPKAKPTRRARGTGSVLPDKRRGGWLAKVPIGRYPNGRTKYVEVRGKTQAEVVEGMKGVAAPGPATTVAEWADRWVKESRAQPSTKSDYKHTVKKHIKPSIGAKKVADLTAADVEQAVRGWKLGANTARKNLGQLKTMLEGARRAKLVTENVARDAVPPKPKKVKTNPFTPDELRRILAAASLNARDALFAMLASVGCRLGESLALDVADFSSTTGEISITKTWDKEHGIRPPKSENGIRTVTVPAPALAALRLAVGGRTKGVLFASETGTRRAHAHVRDNWKRLLKGQGIPYRSPHHLRHSVATHSIAAGTHVGNVARDLGDSVQTIIRTYVHATTGPGVREVMEKLLSAK